MTSGLAAREPTGTDARIPAGRATWPVWIWLTLGVVVLVTQAGAAPVTTPR